MTNLIEELYFENFNQDARNAPSHEKCAVYTTKAIKLRDKFLAALEEEQMQLYMEYDEALKDLGNMTNRENFVAGFRFGARFTLDTFCE